MISQVTRLVALSSPYNTIH
jgi:hypothetical protein